jgi:hypothetical protein
MKPIVYMMLGLPGSGKTTYSKKLQEDLGIQRFSIDVEYFDMVGNNQNEHRDFVIEKQISLGIKKKVSEILKSGQSVILDYCPWTKSERDKYRKFIEECGAECRIIYFDVPEEELLKRHRNRNKLNSNDYQYMTPEMLKDFYIRFEPPHDEKIEIINQ